MLSTLRPLSQTLAKRTAYDKLIARVATHPRLFSTAGGYDATLTCYGCGNTVSGADSLAFKCDKAHELPSVDHILMPATSVKVSAIADMVSKFDAKVDPENISPFVKYRAMLYPYRVAMSLGWTDSEYVQLVSQLDDEIEKFDGVGFRETPLHWSEDLNAFVKVESNNVAQSHKARHLFNVMTYLLVLEKTRPTLKTDRRLAVASCGNAGLAAATIARAANWPIDVCIPDDASPAIVEKLKKLNADIRICPRGVPSVTTSFGEVSTEGAADPTVAVFKNLVEHHGSIPFSVQGSECGLAAEGGQTLAWEILDAAMRQGRTLDFDSIFVQVGGGALGAGLAQGFSRAVSGELGEVVKGLKMDKAPSLTCVQAEGNAPLHRAYQRMTDANLTPEVAKSRKPEFMFPWENPTSIASGILDDETYDWVQLAEGMHRTDGDVLLVDDEAVIKAKECAEKVFKVNACHTGSVGLASLMTRNRGLSPSARPSIAILSGLDRSSRAFSTRSRPFSTSTKASPSEWVRNGITYKALPRDYDPEALFNFNVTHGSTPHNYIPEEPVRKHFAKVKTGETVVWGAFDAAGELAGFISGELGGGYWLQTSGGEAEDAKCFINEFVVSPNYRGKRIGVNLTAVSIDPKLGIFGINPNVKEMYTTVHVDNIASRTAFIKGGYSESITYADSLRGRNTTVLKFQGAEIASSSNRRGNSQPMRVIGIQSGNAVDGIDVGIFEFDPLDRSGKDPRALAGSINYKTIANKTFPFTAEERNWVLGLRAMRLTDGNEYAIGNYRFGEWFADRVNSLLKESGIDKSTVQLIGSHGQTVSGHPHWEFGDLSVIAQQTGITTAGDFRPADVAAGGNGTPCTCTYDSIMLRPKAGEKQWRVTINIGGTSSVTFCPPWPVKGEEGLIPGGLDPGLGVFFMDLTVRAIDPTLEFDDDGKMARSGKVSEELLAEFLTYKYYAPDRQLPIGVGPDDFPETLWIRWHARAQELGVSNVDLLATFTELTAKQIALACAKHGGEHITNGATDDILLRGGVCNNSFFVERLRANMETQLKTKIDRIKTLEDVGIDEDSWENAMYAMFGYLCYNNVYNFVPSCTGAVRPVVGGRIAPGENFHSVRLTDTPM